MSQKRKKITVIAKPTTRCNQACSYCYVDPDEEAMSMDGETLTNFLLNSPDLVGRHGNVHIIWHGGEPLLMGLGFYKKVLDIEREVERRSNVKFENSMQSNLTLVDTKTAKFIKKHGIDIGTSIDGPKNLHDLNRKMKGGKGSFDYVMAGVRNLERYHVDLGAICVLNKTNKDHVREIYDFFKSIGMSFKLNPLIKSKRVQMKEDELGISEQDYLDATKQLFDLWYFDRASSISVDSISEELLFPVVHGSCGSCSYGNSPCQENFISVHPNGNVYPCGRFNEAQFLFGNVNKDSIENILKSDVRKFFIERRSKLAECSGCSESSLCHGGCPNDAYLEYGTIERKNPYCASRREALTYSRGIVMQDLLKAKVGD